MKLFLKRVLSSTARGVLGRKGTARLGQFLYNEACLSVGNDPVSNGEWLIQSAVCRIAKSSNSPVIIFDVGANVGEWSRAMAARLSSNGVSYVIHAFEPFPDTFQLLSRNIEAWNLTKAVIPHNRALSAASSEREFFSLGAGAGRNSLHPIPDAEATTRTIVPCSTLDAECDGAHITAPLFTKIDTEGHDFEVILGAAGLIDASRVRIIQFEYNHRWIMARHYLRDAFEFFLPRGYRIGKETRFGVEFYERWDPLLETFHEDNFLAVTADCVGMFPAVRWWNQG
jgi:FkbM family methyltransferase